MLDSIYHMRQRLTLKSHFCRKKLVITYYVRNVVMDVITFPENLLLNLLHGVIHSQTRSHMINGDGTKRCIIMSHDCTLFLH